MVRDFHHSQNSRHQKYDEQQDPRKKELIIFNINGYCNDLNWRRARDLIEENLQLLQDPNYRARLNTDAKALLETIELSSEK